MPATDTDTAPPSSLLTVTGGSTRTVLGLAEARSPSNTTVPSPSRTVTWAPPLAAVSVVAHRAAGCTGR